MTAYGRVIRPDYACPVCGRKGQLWQRKGYSKRDPTKPLYKSSYCIDCEKLRKGIAPSNLYADLPDGYNYHFKRYESYRVKCPENSWGSNSQFPGTEINKMLALGFFYPGTRIVDKDGVVLVVSGEIGKLQRVERMTDERVHEQGKKKD